MGFSESGRRSDPLVLHSRAYGDGPGQAAQEAGVLKRRACPKNGAGGSSHAPAHSLLQRFQGQEMLSNDVHGVGRRAHGS